MKQFGAFEAKTHFSEMLSDVMEGEKFIITKHGVQVAMIVPFVGTDHSMNPIKDAIRTIKSVRKGVTLGSKLSIRSLIDEGRK